jgi:hypothetical protein
MRAERLSGAGRDKTFQVTTRADDRQQRPADLVERRFRAPAPNRLWAVWNANAPAPTWPA